MIRLLAIDAQPSDVIWKHKCPRWGPRRYASKYYRMFKHLIEVATILFLLGFVPTFAYYPDAAAGFQVFDSCVGKAHKGFPINDDHDLREIDCFPMNCELGKGCEMNMVLKDPLIPRAASTDPCQGPCAPLNASINACDMSSSSSFLSCLCNNLQFNNEAQTCYDCYKNEGNQNLLNQISTFIGLCTGGSGPVPPLQTGTSIAAAPPPNTVAVTAPGVTVSVSVPGVPGVSSPAISFITSPTIALKTTPGAGSSTSAVMPTQFLSTGYRQSTEYWKYITAGVAALLWLVA